MEPPSEPEGLAPTAQLERLLVRPPPFSTYTAAELWTDPHTSARMLEFHLDESVSLSSRPTEFITRSCRWLTDLLALRPTSRVLDLGCGPGLYANRLAATGAEVVGVDISERSIRHAEHTADHAADDPADHSADHTATPTYVLGNYLDAQVPGEFDLVLLAMYDLCALSPSQRSRLLVRVRSWLRAGGRFVVDVYGIESLRERTESITEAPNLMDGFWSSEPYHGVLATYVYEDERVVLDRYVIVESDRTRTVDNWLQYFDESTLAGELEASGLAVEQVVGDLAGAALTADRREFAVVATLG
ncbi:MAG: methyltransferase domain-containing protein [Actinomycetota bacterium]